MDKEIKIWYNKEGDYLEVMFDKKAGYFRETDNDSVMEKIDKEGNIIGFSILKVSALKDEDLISVYLKSASQGIHKENIVHESVRGRTSLHESAKAEHGDTNEETIQKPFLKVLNNIQKWTIFTNHIIRAIS